MTDSNTLVHNDIKDFGKLTRYLLGEQGEEPTTSCPGRIYIQCTNDHSFRGNFKDAITSIDMLLSIFKDSNRSNCIPKTDNGTLTDLQNKVLCRAANIQKLTEVEQINLKNEWTEFLKNLADYGNKSYLRSYALRLEMELT
jgi:hypothetical protein